MKALLKTIGIIAMAAIIGFTMTGCPDGGGGGGGGPIPLTENQWKEGTISKADGSIEYTFVAEFGKMYRVWWNDGGEGDLTYTGDIKVSAYKSNKEAIFEDVDSAWGTAKTYTPPFSLDPDVITRKETISLRVELKDNDVANAGKFAIVYSTGTTKPPNFPSSGIIPLTENQWKDGSITNANGADWYSLSVISGTEYKFWWNETGSTNGDGNKTGNVSVSAYYSNGTVVALTSGNFIDRPTAWATPTSFTAASSGTVYVKVTPASSSDAGTYGIVYSTGNTRPPILFSVPATALTEYKWKDGNIVENGEDWYSFFVTGGTTYRLWWNERGSNGDGTKTGDVKVTVMSNEGAILLTERDTSWSTATSYMATYTDIVYVKVAGTYTGTYGIVYSSKTIRPIVLPATITPLIADQWKDGNIAANGEDWYSFDVNSGTYQLWWNEVVTGTAGTGNGAKSADIAVSAWYSDGTAIITSQNAAWATAVSFTAASSDTVYIKVVPSSITYGNAYGIVYSTGTTRPPAPVNNATATPLAEDTWKNGYIARYGEDWYSFDVNSGTTYQLWSNASGGGTAGDSTKTASINLYILYDNGTSIFSYRIYTWAEALSFTPTSNCKVYVKILASSSGTYGIVYSSQTTRPPIPFPTDTIPLVANQWKNGEISMASEDWYSFDVTNVTTYRLWWNERGSNGDGTQTGDVRVFAYYSNGTVIFRDQNTAWSTSQQFTANSTGKVYLQVVPYTASGSGTNDQVFYPGSYGIVFSTSSTRPTTP